MLARYLRAFSFLIIPTFKEILNARTSTPSDIEMETSGI